MKQTILICLILAILPGLTFAQHSDESSFIKRLRAYEDTLTMLGKKFINDDEELQRKNANYTFIKTLVSALKVPNSFLFPFDSVKTIKIINSPDNRFRILSWSIMNNDGSYRFYGSVQINTGGNLKIYPLADYSPLLKNPEDSVVDSHKWYGAQYYQIIPVYSPKLYYVLLGWKGNNVKSTKRVIDVLSFKDDKLVFGMPIFDGNNKTRDRVVFEYARQASMHLKYVEDQSLIVFDHLSPPDIKSKNMPDTYGPDLSYDGYRLKNGKWAYVENLDMRNVPEARDNEYVDPKKQAMADKAAAKKKNN